MAATIESEMPIERPIDGSTDCNPVLPTAIVKERQKTMRKERRESLGTTGMWLDGGDLTRSAWKGLPSGKRSLDELGSRIVATISSSCRISAPCWEILLKGCETCFRTPRTSRPSFDEKRALPQDAVL